MCSCAFNPPNTIIQNLFCILLIIYASTGERRSERDVRILLTRPDTNLLIRRSIEENVPNYCNLCCINILGNIVGKHCGSHTLCKYPANVSGPSCRGFLPIRFSFMEQEAIVDMHNTIRNNVSNGLELRSSIPEVGQPSAANMRALQWSSELAMIAERWVSQCIYSYDICRDLDRFPVGQNIGRGSLAHSNEIKLIRQWQNEVKNFEPAHVTRFKSVHLGKHKIGSYSQIVWADTYLVGCARAIFQKSKGPNIYYWSHLVCNYGPTGNIPNLPVYKVGPPCTSCPEGTTCSLEWQGLCSSENNEDLFDYVENKLVVSSAVKSQHIIYVQMVMLMPLACVLCNK